MTVALPFTLTAGAVENVGHVQANDEALRDAINALPNQRPPQGPETNLKIIRGTVDIAGNISGGSGFTVSRTQVGQYTITFSSAFSARPAVTVTTSSPGTIVTLNGNPPALGSSAGLLGYTTAGAATDISFSFIAIGPA